MTPAASDALALMSTQSSSPLFLLLVRDPVDGQPEPTPAQLEKLFAWFRDLKQRGHLVAVSPLHDSPGKILRGGRTPRVTDGPFVESKEIVGGYVMVTAKNLAQAVALAKRFPMFAAGRSLEVRRIDPLEDAAYPPI